jgi:hypothetical protein
VYDFCLFLESIKDFKRLEKVIEKIKEHHLEKWLSKESGSEKLNYIILKLV